MAPTKLTRRKQREVFGLTLKVFVIADLSLHEIEKYTWRHLLEALNPGAVLPTFEEFSGLFLDDAYNKTVAPALRLPFGASVTLRHVGTHSRARGCSDLMVFTSLGNTFASPVPASKGDQFDHEKVLREELRRLEQERNLNVLAIVTDLWGGTKWARDKVLSDYPRVFGIDCFHDQMRLVFATCFAQNQDLANTIRSMCTLTDWYNDVRWRSHLEELYKAQRASQDDDFEALTVIPGLLSHWETYVTAAKRLLELKDVTQSLFKNKRKELLDGASNNSFRREEFDKTQAIVDDPNFWMNLEFWISPLEPLATASSVAGISATRVDHVALMYARLYNHYTSLPPSTSPVIGSIVDELRRLWAYVDHELFLAGLILNPWVNRSLISEDVDPSVLVELLSKLYKRVTPDIQRDDERFESRARAYLSTTTSDDMFGDESLRLDQMNRLVPDQDPLRAWALLPSDPLASLARHLFSITCTSTDMEPFTRKPGSRLSQDLTLDQAIKIETVRFDTEQEAAARHCSSLRKKFGRPVPEEAEVERKDASWTEGRGLRPYRPMDWGNAHQAYKKLRSEMRSDVEHATLQAEEEAQIQPRSPNPIFALDKIFTRAPSPILDEIWQQAIERHKEQEEYLELFIREEICGLDSDIAKLAGWKYVERGGAEEDHDHDKDSA